MTAGLDPLAYLWRFAAVRVLCWYLRHPGGADRTEACGWLIGRLRACFTPSPKLLVQNELARGRLVDEMDDALDRWLAAAELGAAAGPLWRWR